MSIDPLTIVFAVVAVLVVWKLNSVLGQNTGFQAPRTKAREPAPGRNDNVVNLPTPRSEPQPVDPARWTPFVEKDADAVAGLDAIVSADPSFAPAPFLDGAKTAYEAIVTAFASGERKTLQNLLARDVYDGFNAAIVEREKRRETLTTTFVSLDEARITAAALEGRSSRVGVRFLSKQISTTRGQDGQPVSGSTDKIVDMDDIWTFARDTGSRDPNWKLVATESGQ